MITNIGYKEKNKLSFKKNMKFYIHNLKNIKTILLTRKKVKNGYFMIYH